MVRSILLTALVLFLAATTAEAGPFSRFQSTSAQPGALTTIKRRIAAPIPSDAPPPGTSVRYPILAKFALASGPAWAPGAPPPALEGGIRKAPLQQAYRIGATVFDYIGGAFTPIGLAGPPLVRTFHVALNGSPYVGHPIKTALWVGNPLAARVGDMVQKRRGKL